MVLASMSKCTKLLQNTVFNASDVACIKGLGYAML